MNSRLMAPVDVVDSLQATFQKISHSLAWSGIFAVMRPVQFSGRFRLAARLLGPYDVVGFSGVFVLWRLVLRAAVVLRPRSSPTLG